MDISVEISMYPLKAEYIEPIEDFIDRLNKHPNIVVETNNMSTQVFGDYDEVMGCFTEEMKKTFEEKQKVVFVMKIINVSRRIAHQVQQSSLQELK